MNKKVISIIAIIALVAILGVCLVACNADTYAKRLEKAGYTVEVIDLSEEDKEEGIVWAVSAAKGTSLTDIQMVAVTKFATTEDAKKAVSQNPNCFLISSSSMDQPPISSNAASILASSLSARTVSPVSE